MTVDEFLAACAAGLDEDQESQLVSDAGVPLVKDDAALAALVEVARHDDVVADLVSESCVRVGPDRVATLIELLGVDLVARRWHSTVPRREDLNSWPVTLVLEIDRKKHRNLNRRVIEALVRAAPDDDALKYVGAGPLEDYLSPAEDDVAWIERSCDAIAGFGVAVGNVWGLDRYPRKFVARIETAIGGPVARPERRFRLRRRQSPSA